MSGPETPRNGSIGRPEYEGHVRRSEQDHEAMSKRIERNDHRIDRLESWRDKIAGPIAFLIAVLAIVATASNLAVIWLR